MPEANDVYRPVTVDAARQIAEAFAKDQVIIVTADRKFQKTHFTSYGKSPQDKQEAAFSADLIAGFLEVNFDLKEGFEDFRTIPQAEWAAERERLYAALRQIAKLPHSNPTGDTLHGPCPSCIAEDAINPRTNRPTEVKPA